MKRFLIFLLLTLSILTVLVSCGGGDGGAVEYTVTWNDENGVLLATTKVKEGNVPSYTYSKTDTAEWDYTFNGWSSSNGGEVINELPAVSADTAYYANISQVKRSYTVTFVANGGTSVNAQTVEYGVAPTKPQNPTYTGYTFVGWYTDATFTTEADWTAVVTENISYYAKWNKNEEQSAQPQPDAEYTITWNDENGTLLTTTKVKAGNVPSYTYNKTDTAEWDYTFNGWSNSKGGAVLNQIPAASANATYYANVSQVKRSYTVTFVANGGTSVNAQTVEYGVAPKKPADPTYDGYDFAGWYTDSDCTEAVDWTAVVIGNISYYAKWDEEVANNQVNVVAMLENLLSGYNLNPYSYIPETMQPNYSANAITESKANISYSDFVNVQNMPSAGFGEQWFMVLENLEQSMLFFNILSVVETLSTSSIVVFNNYIDQNPSDTAHHSFSEGIYNITIDFDGETLYYVLDYTAEVSVLGEQIIQIALVTGVEETEKTVRIQIGDANALTYTLTENGYEFAIKYLGVRRAYFSISNNVGGAEGHIYEYLTVSGVEIESAADFYITDNYVSAVGNKADGMVVFDGYISELYDVDSGKMLGYEVKETLLGLTYNTLWFDLSEISGINSIKCVEGDETLFYVNGSSSAWQNKKVEGWSFKKESRRFDIEFRTQHFYVYNEQDEKYEHVAVEVPMLFVQEENYSTLSDDISEKNNITVEVLVNSLDLIKLQADYDSLIDVFIENKEDMTVDVVLAYIGNKISFNN